MKKEFKMVAGWVMSVLGIQNFSKDDNGKLFLTAEQEQKLVEKYGQVFVDGFKADLSKMEVDGDQINLTLSAEERLELDASRQETARLKAQIEATPTAGQVFLVSALQILEKENPTALERCIAYLADRHATPPVPLSAFEPPKGVVSAFPALAMRIHGAVPFASIGKEALVAVLNPADEQLRAELSAVMPCRFYMAMPSAVEAALGKLYSETSAT